MKFDITSIKKESGSSMKIQYDGAIDGVDILDGFTVKDDIHLKGTLSNFNDIIWLDGVLQLNYAGLCNRCLDTVYREMSLSMKEKFSMKPIDDETYLYEGNFIDLTKAVKDNIIVELPVKLLCSEQCKGICPVCGRNLNNNECNCGEDFNKNQDKPTNKFSVLKDLL